VIIIKKIETNSHKYKINYKNTMITFIRNAIDFMFMEEYMPIRNMLNINFIINQGNLSSHEKTLNLTNQILNIKPSKINFIIENNIAISTHKYIENNKTIEQLLQCKGLNKSHCISINKDQHSIIAKVNLYTSTTMY